MVGPRGVTKLQPPPNTKMLPTALYIYIYTYIYIYIYIYIYNIYTYTYIYIYIYIYTNRKFKIVQLYELPNKFFFKEQKKSQLKYYQMVLYTIKNLLPIKDILKTLPSSGINNYIKI